MSLSSTRRIAAGAAASLLLISACAQADEPTATTATLAVEAIQPSSPDGLAEAIEIAINANDEAALRAILPPTAWDSFGDVLLDGFVPDARACSEQRCTIFERDVPRALEIEIEETSGGWVVRTASLESTN